MHVLQIYTHSPESCPVGNAKSLQIMMNWFKKLDTLTAKHGIIVVGVWTDRWGHMSWAVYETPDIETFEKFEQEPENIEKVTINKIETKTVTVAKETLAFFEKIKKSPQ
jgi:hypothetical protein